MVVDLNRSAENPKVFSEFTARLTIAEKKKIISRFHLPFRQKATRLIAQENQTLHLSIHSFTPVLNGIIRSCDIGILYDPKRRIEKKKAQKLKLQLEKNLPSLRVKMNYPYRGTADGHTTELRKKFPESRYIGIELEFNQAWLGQIIDKQKLSLLLTQCIQNLIA